MRMFYDNLIRLFGNLFWGMQFRTCRKFWESTDFYLVLSQNFLQIQKPHRHYFDGCFELSLSQILADCDSPCESTTNQIRIYNFRHCEANLRFAKAIQKNNTTESRPIRGAKNRNQTSSSASADFLLESDKRGSPPKSEKAAAFWRVGGAGRGVQPFLRKESSKSQSKKIVGDSRIAKMDCHENSLRSFSRNDESFKI